MSEIAKTPPMGWNSWDCYGAAVTEEIVRKNAHFMAEHLKEYGWEYIVTDIQWSEPEAKNHEYRNFAELCMDDYSRLIPAEKRFPSAKGNAGFKPLSDYVHSLGLKFGIHIMRGIPRQAVHRNAPIKYSGKTARDIAAMSSTCRWNTDMYGIDMSKDGAQEYYDSIFELYASWGVDYVKVDDIANHYAVDEIEAIEKAIRKSGREMVLSISPGPTPLEKAEHLKQHVNLWRITDDFWDKWELLYNMFERAEKWCAHSMRGHYPDADMLPIGHILQDYDKNIVTKFTTDEQITMLSLWCMLRSPLMIGGEMTTFDEFTMSLLTNLDLIDILNHSYLPRQLFRRGEPGKESIAWISVREDGGFNAALFNADDNRKTVTLKLSDFGIDGDFYAKNVWTGEQCGKIGNIVSAEVSAHGAAVFVLKK